MPVRRRQTLPWMGVSYPSIRFIWAVRPGDLVLVSVNLYSDFTIVAVMNASRINIHVSRSSLLREKRQGACQVDKRQPTLQRRFSSSVDPAQSASRMHLWGVDGTFIPCGRVANRAL